jgi:phage protein D
VALPSSDSLFSGLFAGVAAARQPGLQVSANGAVLSGVVSVSVTSNNHLAADRFTFQCAVSAEPVADATFWAAQTDIAVTIGLSADGGGPYPALIQGAVDHVTFDAVRQTVRVEGRDLTARLIEARTQETFSNRTSSEIASLLAARHGLTADVTPTTALAGTYYEHEHDRVTLDQFSRATTEWDLLVFLAQQEGFDVYVRGTTLSFHPAFTADGTTGTTIGPGDVTQLRLERALTLARDIQVTVKSWNSRQERAFTQTAQTSGRGAQGETPQRYVIVRPNLTTDQALKLAQQKLAELSRHERVLAARMPGDVSLSPRDLLTLQGTGTAFDQDYYIDEIERSVDVAHGFVQTVRARNTSPASQATPPGDMVAATTN